MNAVNKIEAAAAGNQSGAVGTINGKEIGCSLSRTSGRALWTINGVKASRSDVLNEQAAAQAAALFANSPAFRAACNAREAA